MSKSKAISRPFEQTAQQRAELDALRRMLDISEGTFSLSVAVCNSPALRDHLIEHVTGEVEGIQVVRVPEDARDVFDLVRQQIPNGSPRAIFVSDLEKALAEDKRSRVVQGLNVSREQWQSAFQCPVVFWLPEYVQSLVMTQARDLWSWISHQLEFVSERTSPAAGLHASFAGNISLAGNLDVHGKHFRIAELEQRIADADERLDGLLKQHVPLWLTELAHLYRSLGDLERAESSFRKMLEISERLGQLDGIAVAYTNLGLIHETRGDLTEAERMYTQSLLIDQRLGRLEGIAGDYGNLGIIREMRGESDEAEKMLCKSLEIYEHLGQREGIANANGNLAAIYLKRGDLDKAEEMIGKALRIDEELGRLEGMASHYGNLGLVYQKRGDLDNAEKMHIKSLEIDQRLGRLEGIASQYGNLGQVCQARGDLDAAEKMHNRAVEINQKLGQLENLARGYINLGSVFRARGDITKLRAYWERALALFQKIGMENEVRVVRSWISNLPKNGQQS